MLYVIDVKLVMVAVGVVVVGVGWVGYLPALVCKLVYII